MVLEKTLKSSLDYMLNFSEGLDNEKKLIFIFYPFLELYAPEVIEMTYQIKR